MKLSRLILALAIPIMLLWPGAALASHSTCWPVIDGEAMPCEAPSARIVMIDSTHVRFVFDNRGGDEAVRFDFWYKRWSDRWITHRHRIARPGQVIRTPIKHVKRHSVVMVGAWGELFALRVIR